MSILRFALLIPVVALALVIFSAESRDGAGRVDLRQPEAPRHAGFLFAVRDTKGRPARWTSCEPIRLVINLRQAPPAAGHAVRVAASRVGSAAGLQIVITSTTLAEPSANWGTRPRGGRWPSVLVAFVRPAQRLLSDAESSAETMSVWVRRPGGRLEYVSGEVLVNAAQNGLYGDGADGRPSRVRLFEHELAHLVGLAHVDDAKSLMYPTIMQVRGWSDGDRLGLHRLARGPCPRTPAAG